MSINLTQCFVYETDSLKSLGKVLDTIARIDFDSKPSEYTQLFLTQRAGSFDNGKKWIGPEGMPASDPAGWSKPRFLHVCTLADYKSEIRDGDERFDDHKGLVKRAISLMKGANTARFFQECGNGYTDWFNTRDGDVEVGYRLSHRPLGGWNNLDLSLCHIYYGK